MRNEGCRGNHCGCPWVRREGVWLAGCVFLRWQAGSRPGGRLTFFASPKKVSKKRRATSVPFGFLALLAAFGALANSLRSNSASALIRTLLRCSARPNGGGIPLGSSASRTSPEWLVRFANFAGGACSLRSPRVWRAVCSLRFACRPYRRISFLILHSFFAQFYMFSTHRIPYSSLLQPHPRATTRVAPTPSPLTRARHAVPLRPHSSLLQPPPRATTRVVPAISPLTRARHAVPLRPHSSLLRPPPRATTRVAPTPSPLTRARHAVPLRPHSSLLQPPPRATTRVAPTTSPLTPTTSLLRPHSSPLTPHSSLLTPHSSLLTPHSSLLQPHPSKRWLAKGCGGAGWGCALGGGRCNCRCGCRCGVSMGRWVG